MSERSSTKLPKATGAAMDAGIFSGARYFPGKWIATRSGFLRFGSLGISQ